MLVRPTLSSSSRLDRIPARRRDEATGSKAQPDQFAEAKQGTKETQANPRRPPWFIGPADCNHNCNHTLLSESSISFNQIQYRFRNNLWLQLQWLQSAGPTGVCETTTILVSGLWPAVLRQKLLSASDLVFFKLSVLRVFLSGGVFFVTDTGMSDARFPKRTPCREGALWDSHLPIFSFLFLLDRILRRSSCLRASLSQAT